MNKREEEENYLNVCACVCYNIGHIQHKGKSKELND